MEKTITIKIEDARKWYLSDSVELKKLALIAFKESELIMCGVPKSVEEFKAMTGYKEVEFPEGFLLSRREQTEYNAHMMLKCIRNMWRGDDDEFRRTLKSRAYQQCIAMSHDSERGEKLYVTELYTSYNEFLSFPSWEMAEQFLACFEDLIKKAGNLI
jgi:hypothetical protein